MFAEHSLECLRSQKLKPGLKFSFGDTVKTLESSRSFSCYLIKLISVYSRRFIHKIDDLVHP